MVLLCSWLYCRSMARTTNLSPWFRGDLKVEVVRMLFRVPRNRNPRQIVDEIVSTKLNRLAGCCMPSRWLILLRGITVGSEWIVVNRWISKNCNFTNSVISSIFNCEKGVDGNYRIRGFFERFLDLLIDRKELCIDRIIILRKNEIVSINYRRGYCCKKVKMYFKKRVIFHSLERAGMVSISHRKISVAQVTVYRERKVPIQQVEQNDCGEKEHLPSFKLLRLTII